MLFTIASTLASCVCNAAWPVWLTLVYLNNLTWVWSSIMALLWLHLTPLSKMTPLTLQDFWACANLCAILLLTLLPPVGYGSLWQDPIVQAIQRIEHHQMMQQQEMLNSTLQQQAIQRIEAKLAKQEYKINCCNNRTSCTTNRISCTRWPYSKQIRR